MTRIPLFALVALCAAAPAAAQQAPGMHHGMMVPDGTVLTVSAEGRATRVPDLAIIRAGVTTQAATAAEALSANSARMDRVLAALRAAGVAERDVQTASINLSPRYRYADNEAPTITGYQAANSVTIRFRDVARAGSILDALVREGATDINGPNLTLDEPEAAMDEARTDAIRKARARAELYARAAGLSVDRMLSIDEGGNVSPPGPIMVTAQRMSAESADTAIVPGEQDITVSITVRFLLK